MRMHALTFVLGLKDVVSLLHSFETPCILIILAVFANLFYEFNNPLLDFVFSEKSNLKCSLFADFHIASEKTNCGGQQQQPKPAGKTYMQKSSGYALADLPEPAVPDGYEKVFGPTNGANNAPGVSAPHYMASSLFWLT